MKTLDGRSVFYWHSSSDIMRVTFIRWTRMRMGTGRADTNRLGVGAIVYHSWYYSRIAMPRPDHGLKRGYHRLRPYTDLYRTRTDALRRRRAIRRPKGITS